MKTSFLRKMFLGNVSCLSFVKCIISGVYMSRMRVMYVKMKQNNKQFIVPRLKMKQKRHYMCGIFYNFAIKKNNVKMFGRKSLIIALVLMAVVCQSCHNENVIRKELCSVDTLLTADKDSVAMARLNGLSSKITNEEDRAYFNLLKVRAMYKLDMPISNDVIIDSCINYYKKVTDDKMLAESYYYKSVINYERCSV